MTTFNFASASISARQFLAPLEALMVYRDHKGDLTERRVRLEAVGVWGQDHMVWGHCYLQSAPQEFRLSNIVALRELDGRPVADFKRHLTVDRSAREVKHGKHILIRT
jgi:predicted DNA-binding transcriptional regulator YafY